MIEAAIPRTQPDGAPRGTAPSEFRLDGKVALITGASRGIGRAMALALSRVGADVTLASRDTSALESCAAEIRALGARALVLQTDVLDTAQVRRAIEQTADEHGRLDVLINNAGAGSPIPSLDLTEDDWDTVVSTNLRAVFFASQAAGRIMLEQGGGSIINIGSLASTLGVPRLAHYVASKHGIIGLTRTLSAEWSASGVRVNAISPGAHITHMTEWIRRDPAIESWVLGRIPMGRWGTTQDLEGAAVFLASDASRYITGQNLGVDGGWTSA